ncbi:hypothetical protein [Richelia intracellularis]|nr:hypothetical protein [Richelia intracellularis]
MGSYRRLFINQIPLGGKYSWIFGLFRGCGQSEYAKRRDTHS